jgi:predicted nucleic acid-binding protein
VARFLIDTNVLSETRRGDAEPHVVAWMRATPPQDIATSVMVVGEILEGILRLEPRDPRRAGILRDWLAEIEATHLVLPVDEPVIREWARLRTQFPRQGEFEDTLIAATAAAHRLTVVTRNVRDFAAFALPVLDPWRP